MDYIGDRGRGGSKRTKRWRGGWGLAPKVVLGKLGLLTPEIEDFLHRISVEKGQIQGPPKIQDSPPPLSSEIERPPYPGLQG